MLLRAVWGEAREVSGLRLGRGLCWSVEAQGRANSSGLCDFGWISLSLWTFLSLPVKMEGLEFAGKHLLYLRHFFIGPWSLDSREAPLTDKVPGPSLC